MNAAFSLGSSELLEPLEEPLFDRAAAEHLLTRAAFGAARETVDASVARGLGATVDALLRDARSSADDGRRGDLIALGRLDLAQAWWIERLAASPSPGVRLRERVTLLWHDLFATSHTKVADLALMLGQNATQRELALGRFPDLLRAMLVDPALLVWLDGDQNRVGRPNENLARELFELFALGLGNYTELDVAEAARALSGWTVSGRRARLRERWFDPGPKTIFGREAPIGVDELVAATVAQPACARFIARRLAREFVTPEPEELAVEALAACLVEHEFEISATLRVLLRSRWFYDAAHRGARIASPIEWIARAQIQLDGGPPPLELARAAARMGQDLFRPPSVKGWDGQRAWIGAATWVERQRAALARAEHDSTARALARLDSTMLPRAALERLLPHRAEPAWFAQLEREVSALPAESAARHVVASLLSAPEYQLT